MTFADLISYLNGAASKDLFEITSDLNRYLTDMATQAEIAAWIVFTAGLLAVLAVGLFGFKWIKPLSALLSAYVGYFVGVEVFHRGILTWFETCPEWVAYVLGGVFAVGFLLLGFFKFSYVWCAIAALCSYCAIGFYLEDAQLLAIGAAFLAGMLAIILIRTSVILLSGFGCGILSVGLLSGMFPNVEAFQLGVDNWLSLALAGVMVFLFVSFQFVTNRRRKEYIE